MHSSTMKCLFLMMAALLVVPVAAAAQDTQGKLGVGLSFLSDDGTAVGATVDYSKPFRSLANDRTLGWVGDFSFHRDSDEAFDVESSVNVLGIMGGVRFGGPAGQNENLTWHAQGLVGIMRFSFGGDLEDLCDLVDECSQTEFVFAPGGGIDYSFNPRTALRAQIDFPIGDDISAIRFWIGISRRMGE